MIGQEKTDLASGLCCLEWHSTKYIAEKICGMWARQPAPEMSLLVPESEIEKLRKGYVKLSRELEKNKETETHSRDSWVAIPI